MKEIPRGKVRPDGIDQWNGNCLVSERQMRPAATDSRGRGLDGHLSELPGEFHAPAANHATALSLICAGVLLALFFLTLPGFLAGGEESAPELLAKSPSTLMELAERGPAVGGIAFPWRSSPEQDRIPGQRGADPGNVTSDFEPRSKILRSE